MAVLSDSSLSLYNTHFDEWAKLQISQFMLHTYKLSSLDYCNFGLPIASYKELSKGSQYWNLIILGAQRTNPTTTLP